MLRTPLFGMLPSAAPLNPGSEIGYRSCGCRRTPAKALVCAKVRRVRRTLAEVEMLGSRRISWRCRRATASSQLVVNVLCAGVPRAPPWDLSVRHRNGARRRRVRLARFAGEGGGAICLGNDRLDRASDGGRARPPRHRRACCLPYSQDVIGRAPPIQSTSPGCDSPQPGSPSLWPAVLIGLCLYQRRTVAAAARAMPPDALRRLRLPSSTRPATPECRRGRLGRDLRFQRGILSRVAVA